MFVRPSQKFIGAMLTASMLFAPYEAAFAKIRCEGRWQIIQGERISTPYCEDNYLAQVASSYGSRVSAHAIRNSPFVKKRLCRFIGYDIRVKDICAGYLYEDRLR